MRTRTDSRFAFFILIEAMAWTLSAAVPGGHSVSCAPSAYSVEQVVVDSATEYRFRLDDRHFGTVVNDGGTYAFRPHPGLDVNGWGTTWYAQPFLPGADLKDTTFSLVSVEPQGIRVQAAGAVSRGMSSTYGTWSSDMVYEFDPGARTITVLGDFSISLVGPLSDATGDLNLYKIASNYLHDVPLLSGGTGDTGDMSEAVVSGTGVALTWLPADQPAHFPSDQSDFLQIDVIGRFNNVDTAAMGYAAIAAAFKPGIKVRLTSGGPGQEIRFGAIFNDDRSPWNDNIGITPLVSRTTTSTEFHYDVEMESSATEHWLYLPIVLGP